MMLYKNTKAMICSPDSYTNFFFYIVRVLQEDTLALYLFISYSERQWKKMVSH